MSAQVTAGPTKGRKLPFEFDAALLQRDLASIDTQEWSPHYNERDFGGEWQAVSLRSTDGSARDIQAGTAIDSHFKDTPLLARCTYFREVLARFQCPLKSVRLLSLGPASFIREHCDNALGYEDGEIRIHIPIQTNPGVEFYVCGEALLLEPAHCYYVNVNLPHRVNNRGDARRIHLVIDAVVNDWVRGLFETCDEIPLLQNRCPVFANFADAIFSDEPLLKKLRAIPDRAALIAAIVEEAPARGFAMNESDVEAPAPCSTATALHSTAGWIPVSVAYREAQPIVQWIYAPEHHFTESFFEDSIRICLRHPFTRLFRREMPLRALARVRPAGFIFHMSRCGSTLVSRSLAAAGSTHVISEAPPLDSIVQTNNAEWLEWMVSALAHGHEEKYVLKLDAWHVHSLALFRSVYPDVRWVFVYRDPAEVLVSQLRQPGLQTSPGAMDGLIHGAQWYAAVLEGYMTAALSFRDDPNAMFVDYQELPQAIGGRISNHFGLDLSAEDCQLVEAAQKLDAKNPWAEFENDTAAKQQMAHELPRDAALERLELLYGELSQC